MRQRPVALVTGGSSGIGKEIARGLHRNGYEVYTGARRVDRMNDLDDLGIHTMYLDVTDDESVATAIDTVMTAAGRLDVLVNNAGYGLLGALEDLSIEEAKRQFEVNVFGVGRMIRQVLPIMRDQHRGRIINISSVDGKVPQQLASWYTASKFAIEGLSDALRLEVSQFGIDVIVIEPGGIKTEWGGIAADHIRAASGEGAYAETAEQAVALLDLMNQWASKPHVIARLVNRAALSRRPKTRYSGGAGSQILLLRKILPDRAIDKIMTWTTWWAKAIVDGENKNGQATDLI